VSALVEVTGLTAGYDRAPVIRNLSFAVGPGEIVALLGPNGAGKTTTLRVLSGIVRPLDGTAQVLGMDAGRAQPYRLARRGLAHVAEGRSIFFGLTVGEHFRLGHRGEHLDPETAYEYFPRLRDLAGRRAGLLSGGEQQMLALARALARRPRLLLVDELSLGLAPVIVEQMLPVVRRYATDNGTGVVLVEQHVELALESADRAIALSHGEIVLERPAAELRDDRDLLVASYLGEGAAAAAPG